MFFLPLFQVTALCLWESFPQDCQFFIMLFRVQVQEADCWCGGSTALKVSAQIPSAVSFLQWSTECCCRLLCLCFCHPCPLSHRAGEVPATGHAWNAVVREGNPGTQVSIHPAQYLWNTFLCIISSNPVVAQCHIHSALLTREELWLGGSEPADLVGYSKAGCQWRAPSRILLQVLHEFNCLHNKSHN